MVHKNHPNPALRAWLLSMIVVVTSFSNPIMIPEFPPITEIQMTNPIEWTIEVDLDNIDFIRPDTSCSTDTIMLDCIKSTLSASNVSMKTCAIKETIGVDNMVLLTEKHFPDLQIQTGGTIYLGLKNQTRLWSAPITQNLSSSGTSLKFMYTQDQSYVLSDWTVPPRVLKTTVSRRHGYRERSGIKI